MVTVGAETWWRDAVIYQVYPRSFSDGDGDGVGDLPGIIDRLPHLAELGVDAIWFSPWYPSPMADAGYDVANYRDIDPRFGTLSDAEHLITQAHQLGIRVIVDLVPNHCSQAHPWFQQALAAGPDTPERARFWFRPGRGDTGELPPTELQSIFGGPAWSRVTEPDGQPGQWYLHLFAPQQPDFNWEHPDVWAEFDDILRFWLDRGVDGIRIDSAAVPMKAPALADEACYTDLDRVHDIYRSWRKLVDTYDDQRILIGEVWLPDQERFANYLRADELHTAFNFDYLGCEWHPAKLRACIDSTLAAHAPVKAPATWVMSNHDVTRHVTRYGREDTSFNFATRREGVPVNLRLGETRARAALLLTLALPGAAYLYQGEELGLWEVEDIPVDLRQDPMWLRSAGKNPGRDGCRVPLPWSGDQPPFGFSTHPGQPWLPQPAAWEHRTVAAQTADAGSMLNLYRAALRLRRDEPALGDGAMRWLPAPEGVLAFARDPGFACVVNLSGAPAPVPDHTALLLASAPLALGVRASLSPDHAVWLRLG
jgi:alpha-glucosidase